MSDYEYISKFTAKNWTNIKRKPTGITIHHWGKDGQTFDGIVDWFVRLAKTSCHYVAAAGKVACLVAPGRVAWHAGVWARNLTDIGIECRPEMSDADFETVAQLIADIRKTYGNLPLRPHKKWKNTSCPGRWTNQLDRLSRRANDINKGIPLASKATVHTVKKGETAWGIASKYNTTVLKLKALNKNANLNTIFPGDKIRVK